VLLYKKKKESQFMRAFADMVNLYSMPSTELTNLETESTILSMVKGAEYMPLVLWQQRN
jgi:hypothetical protein